MFTFASWEAKITRLCELLIFNITFPKSFMWQKKSTLLVVLNIKTKLSKQWFRFVRLRKKVDRTQASDIVSSITISKVSESYICVYTLRKTFCLNLITWGCLLIATKLYKRFAYVSRTDLHQDKVKYIKTIDRIIQNIHMFFNI